ncbi:unnamed protein product [Leptosia nina]|uniref:Cytosol aminopeptidase n=1 Tax=Leptosia nina TaxID=320188 RepID=A0AAV1K1W8_9NEOP
MCLAKHHVKTVDPTAYYVSEFISVTEEKSILNNIYASPKPKWTQLSNRRLQNWGGIPHNKGMVAETIPKWLDTYLQKIHKLDLMCDKKPNHVLINEYLPGQGILPHLDGSLFYPTITTISVGSHIVLNFYEPISQDEANLKPQFSFLLEPRSLLILQDQLFSRFLHGIEEIEEDNINASIQNLDMCSEAYKTGMCIPRATRVSLTIRHVPKTSAFKLNIARRRIIRHYCATVQDCNEKEDKKTKEQTQSSVSGNKKGVVLGVYEDGDKFGLSTATEDINQKSGGKLCKYLDNLSCELKLGKAFVVTEVLSDGTCVALTSFGKRDPGYNKLEELNEAKENVRLGVGAGVAALRDRGVLDIAVDAADQPQAAAEAAHLAAWGFQEFKAPESRKGEAKLSPFGPSESEDWALGCILGESQNWARYLSDMPANIMTPIELAQEALNVLCPLGVQVTVRERSWIEAQRMEAFLAVARGSCEPPVLIECQYRPPGAGDRPPVLLGAKGVTFDSGGMCLKRASEMSENRGSMAGAAVVLAALRALALTKTPINVNVVIPVCENMVSGQCMKVGDVVTALNGKSIQIEDTDMEGRLMMADALVYGQVLHKPALVLDVATLTHGVLLATGGGAFGCFSNNDGAWAAMQHAGAISGDRPWRLPLWDYYHREIDNDPAVDLRNRGSGSATPCAGAAFLKNFICSDWVHLDITGVGKLAHARAPPYLNPSRMTGRPTRTLATFLMNAAKQHPGK